MEARTVQGNPENYFRYDKRDVYIAPLLRKKLDKMIYAIEHQNEDGVVLIYGDEGLGKSVLAQQIAAYFDAKFRKGFNINNIHFTSRDHQYNASHSDIKTVHLFDEARRDIGKSNRKANKDEFFNFLSECRDDNQVHIIVLPALSDISEYIALHRAKCIIRVQKRKNFYKGYYRLIKTGAQYKEMLRKNHERKYSPPPKQLTSEMLYFSYFNIVNHDEYKKKKKDYKMVKYAGEEGSNEKKSEKSSSKNTLSKREIETIKNIFQRYKTDLRKSSEAEHRRFYRIVNKLSKNL